MEPRPSEAEVWRMLSAEGYVPDRWASAAGHIYPDHWHPFNKMVVVARGSITFMDCHTGQTFELLPGDRLFIPAGLVHSAVVGPRGVSCFEAIV
jgi:quercetin dioxygenase-like cupin family protein